MTRQYRRYYLRRGLESNHRLQRNHIWLFTSISRRAYSQTAASRLTLRLCHRAILQAACQIGRKAIYRIYAHGQETRLSIPAMAYLWKRRGKRRQRFPSKSRIIASAHELSDFSKWLMIASKHAGRRNSKLCRGIGSPVNVCYFKLDISCISKLFRQLMSSENYFSKSVLNIILYR